MQECLTRRGLLRAAAVGGVALIGAACAPGPSASQSPRPPAAPSSPASPPAAAPGTAGPAAKTGGSPVSVAVGMSGGGGDFPFFVGMGLGYFEQQGIAIKKSNFQSAGDMVAPLASGELWAGGGSDSAGLFNAFARGVKIKIVADKGSSNPNVPYQSIVIRKDVADRVKDYKDLRGLNFALSGKGVTTEQWLAIALQKGGLTLQDVRTVTLSFPNMYSALANKSVDAAILPEPWTTRAMDAGIAVRWRSGGEFYPGHYISLVLYSPTFIEQQRDAANGFMVAYMQAVRSYLDAFLKGQDQDKIVDILVKATDINEPALFRRMVPLYIDPNLTVNIKSLEEDQDWYATNGYVPKKSDLTDIVDNRFVEYALGKLGKR